jgi:tetratricopeptide (TPR) repeat protein
MAAYLFLISTFIVWFLRKILLTNGTTHEQNTLILGLFSAWVTIQITNFFGFSVVIIGLFFFLIPAFSFILQKGDAPVSQDFPSDSSSKWIILGAVSIVAIIMELNLLNMWRADKAYAYGKNLNSSQVQQYLPALPYLLEAVALNPDEPTFRDELSYNQAVLASALYQKIEESTASSIINLTKDQKLALKFPSINLSTQDLISSATENSNLAVEISPESLPFWKTRTKTLFELATIDQNYLPRGLAAIQRAAELAPTDAKVHYNLGLILAQNGQLTEAIRVLEETAQMKPDYRDAYYALGLYYNQAGEKEKSRASMLYILTKIGPDAEAKKFLEGN